MSILINPGTGHVKGPVREAWALRSLFLLLEKAGVDGANLHGPTTEGDGRWDWRVRLGRRHVDVSMPGCSLARLLDTSNPWQPRIYVNGNSWYWSFAVGCVADELLDGA